MTFLDLFVRLNTRLDSLDKKLESLDTDVQMLLNNRTGTGGNVTNDIDASDVEYIEQIGSGNFATVHRCRWNSKEVAVKVLKADCVNTIGFMFEFNKIRKLRHKNLIRIYGLYGKQWPPHIVTEYGKGSLLNYLRKNKSSIINNWRKLLQIGYQVSQGLAYLESENFVHRSLAARNCFYGENQPCKIADYGLTKVIPTKTPSMPIRWMPPEFFDLQEYTPKTDLWSLGVVLWEIFKCGKMPYGTVSNATVVDIVSNKRGVLEKPGHCPDAVYYVMKQCWTYDAVQRPTAADISVQLEDILRS